MLRAIRTIELSVLVGVLAAAGAGCATVSAGRGGGRDLHATIHIGGDTARALLSGPALLLHVNVDGRDDLALYAVARKNGSEADCRADPRGERRRLRPGVVNRVNLAVAADQTVCVAAMPNTHGAAIMWHARRMDGGAATPPAFALDARPRKLSRRSNRLSDRARATPLIGSRSVSGGVARPLPWRGATHDAPPARPFA
jgi:hypothetical protein